jgi:triosephosphate isomerase
VRPLVGSSSKMNLTSSEARTYLLTLRDLVVGMDGVDLFVLPPFTSLWVARECLEGSAVAWGAQDMHADEDGAHTGDISARMLADLGCAYVEVGHSERRRDHHETDAIVAAKVAQAARHGLTPVMCVGEAVRADATTAGPTVARQVERGLALLEPGTRPALVIAYEPVWAIGSGATSADPAHIEVMHGHIRGSLEAVGRAADARVIYGGSVDPGTAAAILARDGVDGLFVGRAALDPAVFAAIARIAVDSRG